MYKFITGILIIVAVRSEFIADLLCIRLFALYQTSEIALSVGRSVISQTSGCSEDAVESTFPLNLSVKCSVVDFSESGCAQPVCQLQLASEAISSDDAPLLQP